MQPGRSRSSSTQFYSATLDRPIDKPFSNELVVLELECDYHAGGSRIAQYAAIRMHEHEVNWSNWLPAGHLNQTNHQPTNSAIALMATHSSMPGSVSPGEGSRMGYHEHSRKI